MKRLILFLFIAFAVSGCKYLESIISIYGLWMRNDTVKTIGVWGTYEQPTDTLLPQNKPNIEFIPESAYLDDKWNNPYDMVMGDSYNWLKQLSDNDTIRIYIFDLEVFENTDWSIIREQYLVKQRYDFTKEQLRGLTLRFSYPPTPEMKDIKMWPPYEEAIKQDEKQAE